MNSFAQSTDLKKENVRIEQDKLFYLKHTDLCWDVVMSRDTTIDTLNLVISKQDQALKQCKSTTGIAIRVANAKNDTIASVKKSLSDQVSKTEKQTSRKKVWRKIAIVSDIIIFAEVVYIYSKQMLFKWN